MNGKKLTMELDTGAAVSLISTHTKKQMFPEVPLINTPTVLTTFTGEQIPVAGVMEAKVRYCGKSYSLQIHVVEGCGPSLMGRDWLSVVGLDWGNIKVTTTQSTQAKMEALLQKFQQVFPEGLGKMSSFEASLHLKPLATPKYHKARSVPFALKEAIEMELARVEKAGVIEKVTHSQWAAPIVPVLKGDGKLRLCGDYKVTVNPMLEVNRYPLPKPDDLFAILAGGKHFTKIDLTNTYQQMSLDEKS